MMILLALPLAALLLFPRLVVAKCYEPSIAFPVPTWDKEAIDLQGAFERIEGKLKHLNGRNEFNKTSYSIEVTSSSETLWSTHHTASILNKTRPGDRHVSGKSQYRIASITKTFTTLAILHLASDGRLSLDDPVIKHIPELGSPDYVLPFKDITLRILASQLSGLPREFAQSDLYNHHEQLKDPIAIGLPPVSGHGMPSCDEYNHYKRACNESDLLERLKKAEPLFAPNQKSTYSNVNYEILGLVIANVANVSYEQYISETILQPLGMQSSSFETPSDDHAVLPVMAGGNYWDVQEGVQNPTGGLYSTSTDLSTFIRYILTHYNTLVTGVNWLLPASWSTGINSFYGMPFETFRTDKILEHSRRPVTFVTKSGGLPGYKSNIIVLEEYGLGFTILVGGDADMLTEVRELVTKEVVREAESTVWQKLRKTHQGSYFATDDSLDSSIELASSPAKGLHVKRFISNGTQVIPGFLDGLLGDEGAGESYAQLIPTLLFKNETSQEGEIWRVLSVSERRRHYQDNIWDDFCITDVDQLTYAGLPLNEVVFWHEKGELELPAWRVTMKRAGKKEDGGKLIVQN